MESQADLGQQLDALRADLNQLRSDMSEMIQTLVQTGKAEAGEMKEKIQTETSRRMHELRDDAREKGQMFADRVETAIEENPMSSVLTALGIGFLVGFITSHR